MAALCSICGTETQLYDHGVPVCVQCIEALGKGQKPPAREQSQHSENQTT